MSESSYWPVWPRCPECGSERTERIPDPQSADAECTDCGHAFRDLPPGARECRECAGAGTWRYPGVAWPILCEPCAGAGWVQVVPVPAWRSGAAETPG